MIYTTKALSLPPLFLPLPVGEMSDEGGQRGLNLKNIKT